MPDDETHEVNRWLMAERFGWPLEYVDSLDMVELARGQEILKAVDAGQAHRQAREARKTRSKR